MGGKAAHYGLLLRAIPASTHVAAALTFNVWLDFLDQSLQGGSKLRDEIASRLAPFASYPPSNFAALSTALEGIRDLIDDPDVTAFSPDLRAAIVATLQDLRFGFDASKNIRFRSSTNVEDSAQFTGAGLYDSRSGCLLDDLDADASGPSPATRRKRTSAGSSGRFARSSRASTSTTPFSSVCGGAWTRARSAWPSSSITRSPDEIEIANGVATLSTSAPNYEIEMVTQVGATSVTNPSDGSIPETVRILFFSPGMAVEMVEESNRLPLGGKVLGWTQEYEQFAQLFVAVARRFALETGKSSFTLDFEYKKTAPGNQLIVKQVREIPVPNRTETVAPFLL